MNENENLVPVEGAENAEQTAEQTEKTYTEAEFNAKLDEVLGKKIARKEAKIRKEYDRRYGGLIDTLKAGTGKEDVDELNETFTKFYESKGIKINKKPDYTDKDIEILARAEADEFIRGGYEDVVEEANRLSELGAERMSPKEKAVFMLLTEHAKNADKARELAEIGVTEDVYNSQEFKDFAGQFNSKTPIKKIYEIYSKTQPKKEIRTAGSMKSNDSADGGVKDFYSFEEAKRFTKKDFDNNPALFKAVEKSMAKW